MGRVGREGVITGYILFLVILVIDFFIYGLITAYYDGTLDRIDAKYRNNKDLK